jgi:hypothetical protein
MRKVFLFVSALMLSLSFTSCERAGCEGILVNLYGSERGVDDVSMVTGRVFYNPATQEVYEYPTYVQTIDYEPFTINAKDGSEFKVDPNVNLKIKDGPRVFRKYRKELTDVINGPVFKYVKDACRINKFTTDQIVSNREAVEQAIEKRLSKLLDKEGFVLDQFTSGLQYPKTIVDAKNRAIQLAQKAANEVQVAEAKKKIVVAEAIVNASLTPLLVKKQWIEAWDGHLPKVTGNASTLVGLNN